MCLPGRNEVKVVIETLKETSSDGERLDFLTKANVMGKFDDPNVVYMEGVITRSIPNMILTELIPNGSLLDFLKVSGCKL